MNRKSFLKRVALISGSAFISLRTNALDQLQRSTTLTGTVSAEGKGIANALISDGFSVVKTDGSGRYSINTHDKAQFVFLSTPSGYDFKVDGNIARQYENLGSRNEYNFTLKKLKKNDDNHQFIIWADPQVKNKKDVAQMMATSVPDVQQLINEMGPNTLVHGICVGDIVWDNLPLYEDYNVAVAKMGIPFFQALGNHDMDYRMGGDETSDKTFKQYFGPTYYSFNRGKAHYIVLDDVRYLGKEREYDGYISEEQLAWMEKDLAFVPKDNLVIINLHIPVHNAVKNKAAFYKLLETFTNVHIMSGHTHYNKNVIQNGIFEHNHGTVCGAWWTGEICGDGTPRGYGVYEVKGTQLKWYYKPTGLTKKHQVSIDIETLTNQKRIIANVWNYDPEWKVECFLDGKRVEMEKQIGFDPEAVRLYLGDKLPVSRPFAEPNKTDHLFMVHCEPAVKNVKVVVTDRFGEKYEASKS
ncbi:MAG TPA: calcineurin-like phosphoesterase family protein [Pedobacter sp.]|nr:calcineurin-like phosphoesterase family protein [Pedobacter sp.]